MQYLHQRRSFIAYTEGRNQSVAASANIIITQSKLRLTLKTKKSVFVLRLTLKTKKSFLRMLLASRIEFCIVFIHLELCCSLCISYCSV